MKKTVLYVVMLLVSLTAVRAQIDSINYNVHFPYYYVEHSFDSIHACSHDGVQCVPGFGGIPDNRPSINGVSWFNMTNRGFALGCHPDSTIHIIGMAVVLHPYGTVTPTSSSTVYDGAFDFFFNYNTELKCRLYYPSGDILQLLDTASFTVKNFDSTSYRLYQVSFDYSGNPGPWNPYTQTSQVSHQKYIMEVYFDHETDISDSVYLYASFDDDTVSCFWAYYEFHTPLSPICIYPEIGYRTFILDSTPDVQSTYGTTHAYPLAFPIIRRDCDTCPVVRGIEVVPSGSNSVFLRWQHGAGHLGWQLAYGPVGMAPENCTTLDFSSPISTILNLSPDTQYVAYLRARCRFARDEWGPWSDPVTLNTTEGIDEAQLAGMITLSPNPATQTVTVDSPLPMTLLEAYDEKGALMTSTSTPTLDVRHWPSGTYLLRIHTPQGTAMKKLTVAR